MDSKKNNFGSGCGILRGVIAGAAGLFCGGLLHATEVIKFSNTSPIVLSTGLSAQGSPYPSSISSLFPKGKIASISVTLKGLTHTNPDDLDIMLVGPNGAGIILMSDAGANLPVNGADVTFADGAGVIPNGSQIATGTYGPANYESTADFFPSPAPSSAGSNLSIFNGLKPSGAWALYVYDDQDNNGGVIAGGWSIRLVIDQPPVPKIDGGRSALTTAQSFLVKGSAKDDLTKVTQVFVRVNNGPLKLAKGRNKWKARVKLRLGTNKVRVYASDTVGNLSSPTVQRLVRLPAGSSL